MLYTPQHFQMNDKKNLSSIITQYSFATLISVKNNLPVISHLPLISDADPQMSQPVRLLGHMARANPHWRIFTTPDPPSLSQDSAQQTNVTAIFHGPHAYVSPRWYAPKPDNVPTWNYTVLHAHGRANTIDEHDRAYAVLQKLVAYFDPKWPLELSESDRIEMLNEIVVFEILVTKMDGKFKLSQNRTASERVSIAKELLASELESDRRLGQLMK